MEPLPTTPRESAGGKIGSQIAFLMFSIVGGTCLILAGMANSQPIRDWIRNAAWEQANWKKGIPLFCFNDHFLDSEDRLLHEELPSADFSRGGVYFLGASSVTWALKLWDLPLECRPLIRNFSMIGTNHADQYDLVRFLVEQKGLLEAGGEKTLMIFGVSYHSTHNARVKESGPGEGFVRLWTRHGCYTVEPDGSIHVSGLSGPARTIVLERTKITGLMKELVNIAYTPFKRTRVQSPQFYNQAWTQVMEANYDWNDKIQVDVAAFARMVDYLRSRNAKVVVLRMPQGSWEKNVPFDSAYIQQMGKVCDSAGVKMYNFSRLVDDDDFADSVHLSPSGVEKFQRAVMGICLDHLRSTGALPATDPAG